MAELVKEHVFNGKISDVFQNLIKYHRYGDYLPGVTYTEVLESSDGSSCHVRYELNLIKKFYYVLKMYHEENNSIRWELSESNLMKSNNGSWQLEQTSNNQTKATYSLDIKFKGLVPSAVTNKVASGSLPAMFEGFQKLIDENPS